MCSFTLDFYTRVFNDPTSTGLGSNPPNVQAVEHRTFGNFTTDVDWRIDGLGTVAPTHAGRGGSAIFEFFGHPSAPTGLLAPGHDSRFFFISTDATDYDANGGVHDTWW